MVNIPVTDVDLSSLYQQYSARLADALDLESGALCCAGFLERALAPRLLQVVWEGGRVRRVFGPHAEEPVRVPGADEHAALAGGELVMGVGAEGLVACYAPLRARGALLGWVCVEDTAVPPESAALLATVAALSGGALALLEVVSGSDERVVQLETLNDVGRLLSGVLELGTLLEAIYNVTARLIDAPHFYIALYDRGGDFFDLAHIVSNGQPVANRDRWPARVGLAGIVVRERQALCVPDYLEECRRRGLPPRVVSGIDVSRAWLGVPLVVRDQVIGVMVAASPREGYSYKPSHVNVFTTIAAQAAVAIENARLYQRSERQGHQLTVLNHIGRTITSTLDPDRVPALIMEQVSELLNVEEGSLLVEDEESGDLVFTYTIGPIGSQLIGQRLRRGTGLAGYVVETGQSVLSNDVSQDDRFDDSTDRSTGYVTRALLATPLRGVGGVRGVIEVLNRRDASPFTSEDQRLLEAVADYAAIALENARRFGEVDKALARRAEELGRSNDQLQHNLRSLTALNALGMAINTALRTAEEIFGMTVRGVAEMTGALGAGVLSPDGDGFRSVVQVGTPVPLAQHIGGLARRVMTTGRPELLLADMPQILSDIGARALLIVPLRSTQRTLGCICVYYSDSVPDAPDRETVALFATQAAGAVESIELFTAVRAARDQMASVLASTREGVMLITADARVAIANSALHQLCSLGQQSTRDASVEQFIAAWERATLYPPEDWAALRRGLDDVLAGRESFASGALTEGSGPVRFVEWTALPAISSDDEMPRRRGGALLVLRDITDARESERLREDLTHMIVHDLRSPLASVMASIDLLVRGVSGQLTGGQHHVLSIANSSAQQMLEMINTLLDISRLEAGRMPISLGPCELASLVARAAEQLASLAHDRRIAVQLDLDAALPPTQADNGLIVRVVQNLLGNALKFSSRGSTVLVRAFESDEAGGEQRGAGWVTVSVSDQGVGIAPKDREKIFAKFGQVGERRGGTGLGLTFSKLVVEAHGGRIWVESEPGCGSTFFFALPLS